MRICLNLLAATAGGQLTRARAFLERFHCYAGSAELVVLKEKSVLSDCSAATGREVIDVPIGLGQFQAVRRIAWENLMMPSKLRENKIDMYLTFSHYLPKTFPRSLPAVVGVSNLAPFSSSAWDVESPFVRLKMALLKHSITSAARRADRVIALSSTCRDVLIEQGIAPGKIIVASNGVDPFWSQLTIGSGALQECGIARPYLLYVSHFHRYKNHQRLVKAFAILPPPIRDTHQLVLVGKPYDKRYFNEVLALRSDLGLDRDVIVIPGDSGENLRQLYQQAALFVFPSLIENCPNILLEAMAAGAPVVASKLSPMPEFGGGAAEYFDPLDPNDIALRISMLLEKPTLVADMKANSILQSQHFSWDNFTQIVVQQCQVSSKR